MQRMSALPPAPGPHPRARWAPAEFHVADGPPLWTGSPTKPSEVIIEPKLSPRHGPTQAGPTKASMHVLGGKRDNISDTHDIIDQYVSAYK
eukprot:700281-Pyramimonas_sp.AAC.1